MLHYTCKTNQLTKGKTMKTYIQIEYTNGEVQTMKIHEEAQVKVKDIVNTIWSLNEGATLDMVQIHNVTVIRKGLQ